MATVKEYFEKNCPHTFSIDARIHASDGSRSYELDARTHLDFDARAVFASVFIPILAETDACSVAEALFRAPHASVQPLSGYNVRLTPNVPPGSLVQVTRDNGSMYFELTFPDGLKLDSSELRFTQRLHLYFEQALSEQARERLLTSARAASLVVGLCDASYAKKVDALVTPRAFISHDSRDKDGCVRPLVEQLQRLDCPVWYDEFSLKVGDSLRESIEGGLKTTRFCVLVLTPNFLAKGGWPKREYDTAFTREVMENTRVFLPVWHDVTKEDVYAYSPILADRVGVPWSLGPEKVARRLRRAIEAEV